jgi:peroxiredoxin
MNQQLSQLQDQLDTITANTRTLVPAERLAIGERAIAELFATGIEDRILPVGASAPDFVLPDASGRIQRSRDLLALGPLIITFFRGRWCPYCMTELETWRNLYGQIRSSGAFLVAVSPQTQRQSDFTSQQHGLPFPLLHDADSLLAARFGLVYTVPGYHQSYLRSILVNLPFLNGESSWTLPVPATYLLDMHGTVRFAEAHADFRVRPEPADVLYALSTLTRR